MRDQSRSSTVIISCFHSRPPSWRTMAPCTVGLNPLQRGWGRAHPRNEFLMPTSIEGTPCRPKPRGRVGRPKPRGRVGQPKPRGRVGRPKPRGRNRSVLRTQAKLPALGHQSGTSSSAWLWNRSPAVMSMIGTAEPANRWNLSLAEASWRCRSTRLRRPSAVSCSSVATHRRVEPESLDRNRSIQHARARPKPLLP